jgi:CheY-like chemotaxis protein
MAPVRVQLVECDTQTVFHDNRINAPSAKWASPGKGLFRSPVPGRGNYHCRGMPYESRRGGTTQYSVIVGPMPKARTTIAVVEDNVGVRTALQQLLRAASFDTLIFASAEEFLSAGAEERADVLIADVNLPGMTGVALVQRLAASGSVLPAILITARDDPATRHLIHQAGRVPRLRKPFSNDDLLGAIRTALSA